MTNTIIRTHNVTTGDVIASGQAFFIGAVVVSAFVDSSGRVAITTDRGTFRVSVSSTIEVTR